MKRFTNAIANSLKDQNWYAALTLALTLPDACGRMEDPGVGSEARYTAWWDKYMLHHIDILSALSENFIRFWVAAMPTLCAALICTKEAPTSSIKGPETR
jgi:hypothetical protein